MSEMIERVARALALAQGSFPDESWECFEVDARAAIAAMREPTEAMVRAGYDAEPVPSMRAGKAHYVAAWHAMIDEALR